MSSISFSHSLRRLWALERFGPSLRFFIALTGSMTWCWYSGQMELLTPLFLGVIASALAESDDSWQGRLFSLCVTLICFFFTAMAVELLHPYPWLFISALCAATFCLIMLGALGERYATVAYATLILAIYTMIGLEQSRDALAPIWQQPMYLVIGAAIYGVLSVAWYGLFSQQPLQHSLARLFREQCHYLKAKSALFEPIRKAHIESLRLALANQNSRVVAALNDTKAIILHRVGGRSNSKINRYLKLTTKKLGWTKHVTAHILRHSFASTLVRNNASLPAVQNLLGHSDLRVTSRYIHQDLGQLQAAVNLM